MGVSRRAYAALRGVSEAAVRKALAIGRIAAQPDSIIDPVRADLMCAAAIDPAKKRSIQARDLGRDTAAALRNAASKKPVQRQALAITDEKPIDPNVEIGFVLSPKSAWESQVQRLAFSRYFSGSPQAGPATLPMPRPHRLHALDGRDIRFEGCPLLPLWVPPPPDYRFA